MKSRATRTALISAVHSNRDIEECHRRTSRLASLASLLASPTSDRKKNFRYALLMIDMHGKHHFSVRPNVQDRIKLPQVFWAGLKVIGLTPSAVLRKSNLPITIYSGEGVISTSQSFAIWRAIQGLSNDPTLGWKFMSQVETDQYHPTLLAALHARNFRDSVERLARYKQLCSAEEFRFTSKADEIHVEVFWPFAGGEKTPEFMIDAIFALVTELGRRGTKTKLNPKRVELARQPNREDGIEEYFGCPVKYRAKQDVLVFKASDLDRSFITHNEELLEMLSPQFEQALQKKGPKPSILDQVKWVLKRLLAGSRPDLLMVAQELGVSERTLQRRITEEGSTFRQLLNITRQEMVHNYLADDSIEITEVAFLVGFEDPNSFYRAFRSWEGKTPSEWREEIHSGTKRE